MTYTNFTRLPKDMQVQLAKQKGRFLLSRETRFETVALYEVDNFYVELYHDRQLACISIVNGFEGTAGLDPYLETIDLSFL